MKKLSLILLGLSLASRLWAVNPVPLMEAVGFSCRISGVGGATMTVYDESPTAPSVSLGVYNQTLESDVNTAWLQPGKAYTVHFASSGSSEYWLSFTAPAGYAVFLDDNPVDLVYQYTGSPGFNRDYKLELHPVSSIPALQVGQFSGIDVGKAISWEVGLGGLRTGRSAGRILFREKDLVTNAPASRARLYFSAPGDVGQIELHKDGPSSQTLRQIGTPQTYVDLLDISGGYEMRFYSAISSFDGTLYHFDGLNPWRVIKVESTVSNQLKITETEGAVSRVSQLDLTGGSVASGAYVFTLKEGDGATWPRTTVYTSTLPSSPAASPRDLEVAVKDAAGTVSGRTRYRFVAKAWGEEIDSIVADPAGAALTTAYTYFETAPTSGSEAQRGNYRKIKSVVSPTGAWVSYAYWDDWNRRGQLQVETRPWLDAPANFQAASSSVGNSTFHDYAADFSGRHRIESYTEKLITGVRSGLTLTTPTLNQSRNGMYHTALAVATSADWNGQLSSTIETIDARSPANPDYQGLPLAVIRPDGTMDSYGYYNGSYSSGVFTVSTDTHSPCFRTIVWHGTTNASGADAYTSFDGFDLRTIYLVANKSTKEVTIRNQAGDVIRTEKHVYTGGGNFAFLSADDYNYVAGRPTQHYAGNGAVTENFYANGRLTSTVGESGIQTDYTYDALGRVATTTKKGVGASGVYAAQGDITTTNTYDASGHVTKAVSTGGSLSLTAESEYDPAGRLKNSTAPGGYVTAYNYASGGRIVTTTLPGGATKTTETHLDGQVKQVSGTAVVAQNHLYWVDSGGWRGRQSVYGGNYSAWTNTYWDWLGRQREEWKPGWNGNSVGWVNQFNPAGQLYKVSQPGMADTLYEYDSMGTRSFEGLDINANGTLDRAGDDRISFHEWFIHTWDGGATWWFGRNEGVFTTPGSWATHYVSQTNEQLKGFAVGRLACKGANDNFGNTTSVYVDVDRTAKKLTTTTDTPDSYTNATQVSYNGLAMESTDTAGVTMRYGYDALGRQTTSVDPRAGTTTTAYLANTSLVDKMTDPASVVQATYTYDAAGRVIAVKDGLGKYARYEYNGRNQKIHEWGDTAYPVEHVYDALGRQTGMNTFAQSTATFTNDLWPTSPNNAQSTTWNYDGATGFLASKTDAQSHAVTFTYTQAGQIATRTWARSVVTTYAYSATTGELVKVSYTGDNTPPVEYTYNRLGQTATVKDCTGTRTFAYNLGGTLELQSEKLGSFYGDHVIGRGYETTAGFVGRYNRVTVGTEAKPSLYYTVEHSYDATGRIHQVLGVTYDYVPNSHLISTVTDNWSYSSQTRTYLSTSDTLDTIENKWNSTPKAKFDYAHDAMHRITSVARTGEMYDCYGANQLGLIGSFGYNDRSEVTSEVTKLGSAPSTVLTGRDDSYAFDLLGNRQTVTHNGNTATYTTDSLNRYTERTVPGVFDVAGATTGATVTVDGSSSGVVRHGQYFFKGHGLTNTANSVYADLEVSDGTKTDHLLAFLPETAQKFVYDADGNLTADYQTDDGQWDYEYDAENRLKWVAASSGARAAGFPKIAFQFYYDYLGRRILKSKFVWNETTSSWTDTGWQRRYIYDGWNLLYELDGATNRVKLYAWGLDVSGTLQGAGGVGGLILSYDLVSGVLMNPVFDGNGNLVAMLNRADGTIAAAYEYDAFGNTVRESGPYAADNPFRYSTKYTDLETGLVYYGHRYYSPSLGRFINQDPIEEMGGINLYSFCRNNGVNGWDYLGMDEEGYSQTLILGKLNLPTFRVNDTVDLIDPDAGLYDEYEEDWFDWSFWGNYNFDLTSSENIGTLTGIANLLAAIPSNPATTQPVTPVTTTPKTKDPLPTNEVPKPGKAVYSNAPNNAGGVTGVGGVLVEAGLVRDNYNALVAQLRATGQYDPARDAIRAALNAPENSTAMSRSMADLYRWEQAARGITKSNANPTATAAAMNNAGALAKYGGGALMVVGVGASVYTVATAPDPYRAGAQQSAGIIVGYGGASGGAALGATIGTAIFPGIGTGVGAVVGALVGGFGGGYAGQKLGGGAYDAVYGPPHP